MPNVGVGSSGSFVDVSGSFVASAFLVSEGSFVVSGSFVSEGSFVASGSFVGTISEVGVGSDVFVGSGVGSFELTGRSLDSASCTFVGVGAGVDFESSGFFVGVTELSGVLVGFGVSLILF